MNDLIRSILVAALVGLAACGGSSSEATAPAGGGGGGGGDAPRPGADLRDCAMDTDCEPGERCVERLIADCDTCEGGTMRYVCEAQ